MPQEQRDSDLNVQDYHHALVAACTDRLRVRRYEKGAVVVSRGDRGGAVYLVRRGELNVSITDRNGKELILNTIRPGASFGELAVFTGGWRSADVVCRTACELAVIKEDDYLAALRSNADLAIAALEYHARLVCGLTDQVSSLALLDVFGRLVALLNERAIDTRNGLVVEGTSHKDLASAIGASREMVSKILSDLRKAGFIETHRKRIVLKKPLPS